MNEIREEDGYGLVFFEPGTSSSTKIKSIIFFILLSAIVLAQAFYWLFANKVEPIILGMPYGMFFVVLLIAIEFVVLVALYLSDAGTDSEQGGAE